MYRLTVLTALSAILVPIAAQAQPSPTTVGEQPQERRICRAMERPGSLAGSRRVCMTRAEWERQAEQARRDGEEMIAGRDSCTNRGEGGTAISTDTAREQAMSAMARMTC